MLTPVLLGCVLGLRHASDPDHVAAVAAIVTRHRRPLAAAGIGAAWGLGHGLTIVAVGGVLVLLSGTIPASLALVFELGVAGLLVVLGVANLLGARRSEVAKPAPAAMAPLVARSCAVGVAHGLAGSAAVALLALAAMPSAGAAVGYLAAFAAGTVVGMVAFSLGVGVPFAWAGRVPGLQRALLAGSGAVAVGVGLYLAWELGFAHGVL